MADDGTTPVDDKDLQSLMTKAKQIRLDLEINRETGDYKIIGYE